MSTTVHSVPTIHDVRSSRWSQVAAWVVGGTFVAGFFTSLIGDWTGPILGVWFVGTQRPRRGFIWMLTINLVLSLIFGWRGFLVGGLDGALKHLEILLVGEVVGVLPFTFHRLLSPRLPGLLSTVPIAIGVGITHGLIAPVLHLGASSRGNLQTFLTFWFAGVVVWTWNSGFRAKKIGVGAGTFAGVFLIGEGLLVFRPFSGTSLPWIDAAEGTFGWICLGAAVLLSLWAVVIREKLTSWAEKRETVAALRSPVSGNALEAVRDNGQELLVSCAGERFPVRDGIPDFRSPEDLTGDNGKYNHLYETIGGFYDDTQRVFCAFRGVEIDSYFTNYMGMLEVKPGDSVLETSVGTGLNFKYLPQGVKLSGLDLSADMLTNCQANLRRWGMKANLYLGNAERLPFADSSFDVVFHVGGISFFNDKGKAIREMIRVAKPGSLLLIEDETEEYAKSTYEKIPYTSSFYKDRKEPVRVPIDLVPPEMEDIRLDMLKDGKFYAITFRKPLVADKAGRNKIEG